MHDALRELESRWASKRCENERFFCGNWTRRRSKAIFLLTMISKDRSKRGVRVIGFVGSAGGIAGCSSEHLQRHGRSRSGWHFNLLFGG